MSNAPIAVGVDGCRSGWIAAVCYQKPEGEYATSLKHFETVVELAAWRGALESKPFVTIDVPIGLPESVRFRRCDEEARTCLGPMRNSVFMPPGRYLLDAKTYAETQRMVEERRQEEPEARGLNVFTWGILPKIREVDEFARVHPEHQDWLLEVHPEVCFLRWASRLLPGKKSAVGQIERLGLVREEFRDAESAILEDLDTTDKVDLTDVLDAYAALWTALRRLTGEYEILAEELLGGTRARMFV
jgi:predicted RNase H-like nuclease